MQYTCQLKTAYVVIDTHYLTLRRLQYMYIRVPVRRLVLIERLQIEIAVVIPVGVAVAHH